MALEHLDSLPSLREVIAGHGLAARKGLGQHFLLDLNLTKRIVAHAGSLSGINVVEIGPVRGALHVPCWPARHKRSQPLKWTHGA